MEEPREDAQTPAAEQTPEVAPAPEPPAEAPSAPAAEQQPDPTAPQEPATEAPSAATPALDAVEESAQPAGDVPAMETAAVADAPADAPAEAEGEADAPAGAEGEADAPAGAEGESPKGPSLSKIKKLQQSHAHRPKRRGGQPGGGGGEGQGEQAQGGGGQGGDRSKRQRRPKNRPPRPPREKGPLPFNELRDAARAIMRQHGEQASLKVAVAELAPKERNDISDLVKGDGDFRVRARSISAGSLAAGKLGKALAAQQIAVADVKDLWPLFLSKEEAAERQSWIRNAKRRDEERAKRQEERRNRQDRISKEDMEKARDGRVGAQIRFVIAGQDDEKRDRKKKKDEPAKKTTAADLLDRLGY